MKLRKRFDEHINHGAWYATLQRHHIERDGGEVVKHLGSNKRNQLEST